MRKIRKYEKRSKAGLGEKRESDPLLKLRNSGKKLWKDEPADKYVGRLKGWLIPTALDRKGVRL
jgi:hypothetical protein